MNYEIIGTGSKGNCVIVENIMFDCGVSAKQFNEIDLKKIKYVFLTHIHQDHIKKNNLKKLLTKDIFCNKEVFEKFKDVLSEAKEVTIVDNRVYRIDKYNVIGFEVLHDALTHGYSFIGKDISFLYCTDISRANELPDLKYDYIFLEANYDMNKLLLACEKSAKTRERAKRNYRHLSKQDSLMYAINHLKENGKYIPLHQSSDFY